MLLLILAGKDMPKFIYDKPPEKMYKYTSFKGAYSILKSNKIYFAKLSEFNDPFDGLVTPDLSTIEKRKHFIEGVKQILRNLGNAWPMDIFEQTILHDQKAANDFARDMGDKSVKTDPHGFCCLTNTYQSLPMWAHYADNHIGCCLVFDFSAYSSQKQPEELFPFNHMREIKYQDKLPMYDVNPLWHYYAHKSPEWQYEHEWRAIMYDKKVSQAHYPNSFLSRESNGPGFYPCNFLCGVILGDKMEDAYKEVIKIVARQRGIYVQQASRKVYEYGIEVL